MPFSFAPADAYAIPLHLIDQSQFEDWLGHRDANDSRWIGITGFSAAIGEAIVVPDAAGNAKFAAIGYGTKKTRARGRFHLAAGAQKLPAGDYKLTSWPETADMSVESLGWLLSGYRFDRYKKQTQMSARLVAPDGVDAARLEIIAASEALTRDLINTPASDMGPPELEQAVKALSETYGATCTSIIGDELISRNYPLIQAVGRAAEKEPRLLDLRWGETGPKVTLVGKGVCFDTGGLNLKPGASMGLMKKDMGGAANVLGLAQMVMATGLPVQLRVLIPAVENNVAGNAFRPGDVLTSRKGLTVEINNTDAEGRLVLADALALASEENPDLIISMATLTGAARVALGPDLAPYYTDDEEIAQALERAAENQSDPVWRLPFHAPYDSLIEPEIADLDNAPKGGFAGSITAALFLRRFVETQRFMHFDIYGWQPNASPGRPKGGVGQGTRALFAALPELLGL